MFHQWHSRSKVRAQVAMVVALLFIFATLLPAQAQAATSWQLVQMFPGAVCGSYRNGSTPTPTVWLLISLSGTWSRPVNFGIRNLPPGATLARSTFINGNPMPYQPIAPGSGDGTGGALGRVEVTYHLNTTPPNSYAATLWANDGVTERTLPVTLVVKMEKCSHY